MLYNDLHELINGSASTRAYFLSLPVPLQMKLHGYSDSIHSAFSLRKAAEYEILLYEREKRLSQSHIRK